VLAALLLVLPVASQLAAGNRALRFVVEFLTEGRRPWLSRSTAPPSMTVLETGAGPARDAVELWHPGHPGPWPGVVLVHGLTPAGRADPRLRWAAERLARAGLVVAVPELPGLRAQRMEPRDAAIVGTAVQALAARLGVPRARVAVLAVSVGLAPVALALADPAVDARVRLVVALGGYADARELVRYFTTGAYAFGAVHGRAAVDPALAREFLVLNPDLVRDPDDRRAVLAALEGEPSGTPGPEGRAVLALLANRDAGRVDALLAALPPETQALLDALSPARHLRRAHARLILIHGRDDPAIPFTEALRLGAAAPGRARVIVADLIGHVEGRSPTSERLLDLARLWAACYDLLAG
jgi:hypothetical protein